MKSSVTVRVRSILVLVVAVAFATATSPAQTTTRISVAANGAQAAHGASAGVISRDGRYVVIASDSSDLGPLDANGTTDVYRKDLQTGAVVLVSATPSGAAGNGASFWPAVSADGRYVVFSSDATDLVPNDTNANTDVFLRDVTAGTTTLVSHTYGGAASANGFSYFPSISPDGRFVGFNSNASDLVAVDANHKDDAFAYDRISGNMEILSLSSTGVQGNDYTSEVVDVGPGFSDDDRFVVFVTLAGNFAANDGNLWYDVYVRDRLLGTTTRASQSAEGVGGNLDSWSASISADGRWVAFYSEATTLVPDDTNAKADVFVKDMRTGAVERVSVSSDGEQGTGGGGHLQPVDTTSMSADGRYVGFGSGMRNLIPDDVNPWADAYRHDRWTGVTTLISQSTRSVHGDSVSGSTSLSEDGRLVLFGSVSANLVPGDTNAAGDQFLRTLPEPFTVFCAGDGTAGSAPCPCGNTGSFRHGCENASTTGGAVEIATGDASVTADTITLSIALAKPRATCTFVQADGAVAGGGRTLGHGVGCLVGSVRRLATRSADAAGFASYGYGIAGDPPASVGGAIPPTGGTRYYQVWYRDGASFCTGEPFNLTSGIVLAWTP